MMSMLDLNSKFDVVISTTAARLKPLGYKRKRNTFRKLLDGNSGVLEFQRSMANSAESLSFTVNLAVVCGRLLEDYSPPLEKAGAVDGHMRARIGGLIVPRQDPWWVIEQGTDGEALAREVADTVEQMGAPYVERYLRSEDLIAAWKSGDPLGNNDFMRLQYLDRLLGDGS